MTRTRCGKPTCHCAQGLDLHLHVGKDVRLSGEVGRGFQNAARVVLTVNDELPILSHK